MPESKKHILHLNSGEWSSKLYARADHEKYSSACRTAKNVIAMPHGPLIKRKGFEFVAPAKYANRSTNLMKFQFSRDDTILIELGDEYMRFYINGKQIRESAITGVTVTADDPAEFTSDGHGLSDDDEVYLDGFSEMTELNGRWFIVTNATTDTFQVKTRAGDVLDSSDFTEETTGGDVEKVYEIDSPFLSTEVDDVDYVQKDDVVWIAHRNHPVQKLVRLANQNWTLGDAEWVFPPVRDPNVEIGDKLSCDVTDKGESGTLTASGHTPFEEGHKGGYWVLRHVAPAKNQDALQQSSVSDGDDVSGKSVKIFNVWQLETSGKWNGVVKLYKSKHESPDLDSFDSDEWVVVGVYESTDDSGNGKNFNISGDQEGTPRWFFMVNDIHGSSDSAKAQLRPESSIVEGVVRVDKFNDSSSVDVTVIRSIDSTDETDDWSEGAYSDVRGYPQAIAFFEQRLWLAGNVAEPQKIYATKTEEFDTFQTGTNDTDGLALSFSSQERNEILWMADQEKLLVGTTGGEWVVAGTDLNQIVSPTNIVARRQETKGSSRVRPIMVNEQIFYVQSGGRKLREFGYDLERDRFHGFDLSLFSEHLVGAGIKSTAFQALPDSVLWATNKDGDLLSMTYEKDQDVYGWTRHDTDGTFESVETIYGADDDEVWAVVKRQSDVQSVKYIERMTGYYNSDRLSGFEQGVQVCFVVDKSGSMSGDMETVKDQINELAKEYEDTYGSVEFALLGYLDDDFTPKVDFTNSEVIESELENITTSGEIEKGFDALTIAATDFNWKDDTAKIVILFTDEDSDDGSYTQQDAIDALNELGAPLYYGPGGFDSFNDYDQIIDVVGGGFFSDVENLDVVVVDNRLFPATESRKVFLDSCFTYVGDQITKLEGLWHLEGREVVILAEGHVIEGKTVTDGSITLDNTAGLIHVGLPYTSEVQPMALDVDGQNGLSQGYTKRITKVYARLIDTQSLSYWNGQGEYDVSFRTGSQDQSKPPALFTGEKELSLRTNHNTDPTVILKSTSPLPFTLAALIVHYDITGA